MWKVTCQTNKKKKKPEGNVRSIRLSFILFEDTFYLNDQKAKLGG